MKTTDKASQNDPTLLTKCIVNLPGFARRVKKVGETRVTFARKYTETVDERREDTYAQKES